MSHKSVTVLRNPRHRCIDSSRRYFRNSYLLHMHGVCNDDLFLSRLQQDIRQGHNILVVLWIAFQYRETLGFHCMNHLETGKIIFVRLGDALWPVFIRSRSVVYCDQTKIRTRNFYISKAIITKRTVTCITTNCIGAKRIRVTRMRSKGTFINISAFMRRKTRIPD